MQDEIKSLRTKLENITKKTTTINQESIARDDELINCKTLLKEYERVINKCYYSK
jgi:hypothetical protein